MRDPGFYWIKMDEYWVVAQWDSGKWFVPGVSEYYRFEDSEITQIDERKIVRQPEN